MVKSIVQLVIVGMWAVILGVHTRRLLRLAKVKSLAQWGERRLRRSSTASGGGLAAKSTGAKCRPMCCAACS